MNVVLELNMVAAAESFAATGLIVVAAAAVVVVVVDVVDADASIFDY